MDKSAEVKQLQVTTSDDSDKNELSLPRIQLSPGKHKYIVIKASKPNCSEPEWYVRSSTPAECGGLYHADVAKSLVEQLKQMNYAPVVVGGGRIDFCDNQKHAHVYGFSYGFGKGDHELVSQLIEKYSDFSASFDDSDLLY